MTKQRDFTVDLSIILTDEKVQDNFANLDGQLKSALIETYSPILDQIDALYKENPNLDINDERVQKIAIEISQQLEKIDPNPKQSDKLLSTEHGGSSNSMVSHLKFALQGLQNGKNLQEIRKGYEYSGKQRAGLDDRINGQFDEDFTRTKVSLVDQDGKVLDPDFTKTVLSHIEGKPTSQKIINVMKGYFSMSDKQAEFMAARFNQRSIVGVGIAFKTDTPDNISVISGPQETKLIVKDVNGKHTLEKLQFNYTAQCIDHDVPQAEDPEIPNKFIPHIENFSQTTYEADLRPLLVHGKGLKDIPETLTYHAIHPDSAVVVPEALSHRTSRARSYSDQVMEALKGLNLSGLNIKSLTPSTAGSTRSNSVDSVETIPNSPPVTPPATRPSSIDKLKGFFNL